MSKGKTVACPAAPVGQQWVWGPNKKNVTIKVQTNPSFKPTTATATTTTSTSMMEEEETDFCESKKRAGNKLKKKKKDGGPLSFFVEGLAVSPYDVSSVLKACEAVPVVKMQAWLVQVVEKAVYAPNQPPNPLPPYHDVLAKMPIVDALYACSLYMRSKWVPMMKKQHQGRVPVFVWFLSARKSMLPKNVWRDLLCKIETRETGYVNISPVGRDGKRQTNLAVRYQTEGTMLRLLHLLEVLYPTVLRNSGRLRFKIDSSTSHYVHMISTLNHLAFPPFTKPPKDTYKNLPKLKTKLWPHQQATASRVVKGAFLGRRGFADASAVGAGKTLSALASMIKAANDYSKKKALRVNGFLVLVPNKRLIESWKNEIDKHTTGFHFVTQRPNGALVPKDVDLGPNSIVVTTLSRARDHPFTKRWTMVVIDECTSVQNESALQTAEAWRQAVSSDVGVVMLSATFFRARFSKLFYMIRMLMSPIPRSMAYLDALLAEHIICHVPEVKRKWIVNYVPVTIPFALRDKYDRIRSSSSSSEDSKVVYGRLKHLLTREFDACSSLRKKAIERKKRNKRRPLVFANSEREKRLLIEGGGGEDWRRDQDSKQPTIKVLTVHEGSHGLNMQHECDCIITRPHPGDIMEQIKGRIDRPGQSSSVLILDILFAKDTIEEAEAANIRLCGRFMKQYLNPLSEEFCNMALAGKVKQLEAGFDRMLGDQPKKGEDDEKERDNKKRKKKKATSTSNSDRATKKQRRIN